MLPLCFVLGTTSTSGSSLSSTNCRALTLEMFSKCRRRYSCSVSGLIETISITLVSKRRGEPFGPSKLNGDSLHSSKSSPSPEGIDFAGAGESPLVDKLTGSGARRHSSWVTWAKIVVVC